MQSCGGTTFCKHRFCVATQEFSLPSGNVDQNDTDISVSSSNNDVTTFNVTGTSGIIAFVDFLLLGRGKYLRLFLFCCFHIPTRIQPTASTNIPVSHTTTAKMSQNPASKKQSNGIDFTPTIRSDTYDYINPEQWDLSSRAVLVTGASKGLGKDNAISFARAGASKIAIAARSGLEDVEKAMKAAAQKAGRKEPTVLPLKLDVTDKQSVGDAVAKIEQEFGGLDIVINNAGYLENFKKIADSDPEDWWRTWQVNTFGAYLVVRATIPLLLKKSDGLKTILNVSSIGAHVIMGGASAYQAGKMALIRFSEFINAEYGEQGLLSFAVHPGGVMTELASGMPKESHGLLKDQPALAADTFVWLTAERRDWLAGRYISSTWDMKEFADMKEKIVSGDLLKVRLDVGTD